MNFSLARSVRVNFRAGRTTKPTAGLKILQSDNKRLGKLILTPVRT